jgi:hypothetical protein
MKTFILILLYGLNLSLVQAIEAKSLHCQQGQYRLAADFENNKINIFETDEFSLSERSLFGFAHLMSSHNMYLIRTNPSHYFLHLKIKNDGIIKGKFQLDLDETNNTRIGEVEYAGWFSWEPIKFQQCVLQY